MKKILRRSMSLAGAAFAATLSLASLAVEAHADPLWTTFESTPADIDTVNALMSPIQPYLSAPGSTSLVNQSGVGNTSTASIVGSGNLTLLQQSGSNNHSIQAIEGAGSAALLFQNGNDNNVLQASTGDNNFQLVNVQGSNNDIAYIQAGNELAGVLDVSGRNSSVVALQTSKTPNYLMPSGLHGLKDQVVVIVPGRMLVINKNAL
jgi:hypothetical protein